MTRRRLLAGAGLVTVFAAAFLTGLVTLGEAQPAPARAARTLARPDISPRIEALSTPPRVPGLRAAGTSPPPPVPPPGPPAPDDSALDPPPPAPVPAPQPVLPPDPVPR